MNHHPRRGFLAALLAYAGGFMDTEANAQSADPVVVVNAQPLSTRVLATLQARYGGALVPGRYWYDRSTGWWGAEGGPTAGVALPGLALGGVLLADASRGTSGVFINGRQLHALEVAYLRTLGTVVPGRYWADAMGNVGFEGNPWPFVNLYAVARQRYGDLGPHRSGSGAFNSDGRCAYYHGHDAAGNRAGASSGCG